MQIKDTSSWQQYSLNGSVPFQQYNTFCHTAEGTRVQGVDLDSTCPRSQSDQASVGLAGETGMIFLGCTSQLTGHIGSTANTPSESMLLWVRDVLVAHWGCCWGNVNRTPQKIFHNPPDVLERHWVLDKQNQGNTQASAQEY